MIQEITILCTGLILATGVGYVLFLFWLHQQKTAVREILENSNWTTEQIDEALQTNNLDEVRRLIYYYGQQDEIDRIREDLPEDEDDFGEQGQ